MQLKKKREKSSFCQTCGDEGGSSGEKRRDERKEEPKDEETKQV